MTRSERQRKRFVQHRARQLADPQFRKAFEDNLDILRLVASIVTLRERKRLSQTELAAQIHSSQAVISRLEHGRNVELRTIQKVAKALHAKLRIELVPLKEQKSRKPLL